MKRIHVAIIVSLLMTIAILAITNPEYGRYKMQDYVEGKMIHNYIIFSIYQQHSGYTLSDDGKYRIYKRYIGIANGFYEIKPLKVKQE
ncbi:MAG TPA: hypothetical protein VMT76_09170 [Puia sp.]|nr:hypothetical protein [Puia sp.]